MQNFEFEEDDNKETDFSDLPDLISVSDDGECDTADISSKTSQVFSRLSVLNRGLQKVTEDISNLKTDAADITELMKILCMLLSKRSACCENIVLNMEETSDEGELCCEHFSSPLYAKIPSQEKRFYLEDDEQEDNDDEEEEDHNEEEEDHNDDASEEEDEDVPFSDDDEADVDEDPNGLGESTIFD